MGSHRSSVVLIVALLAAVACDGPGGALAPNGSVTGSDDSPDPVTTAWKHGKIPLVVRDQCDPATFNQADAAGPGDCISTPTITRRVTFAEAIGQLQQHHNIRGWFNNPGFVEATPGSFIDALNTGGEVHTFTRVAKYGGGIVPTLNALSGSTTVAPE